MTTITAAVAAIDWQQLSADLQRNGYAIVPGFLDQQQCEQLASQYNNPQGYRKTVVMERYRFGRGQYKYYSYPLPPLVQAIREHVYPRLVPLANAWMEMLNIAQEFPDSLSELQAQCRAKGQCQPTPLCLKYTQGGYNTLHQDLYGEVYFPLQAVFLLSEPGSDFSGGEFVLTQQIPRAQSRAIVLNPARGDMLIFTTNFRPEKGVRGYYRATMKHGISEVRSGERHALGVIFHDAVS